MRVSVFAFALLLVTTTGAGAQTTPAARTATPDGASAKLDEYLLKWEQAMKNITTLSAVLARQDKDKSFGTSTKFTGSAQYMKVGTGATALNLAALEMKADGKTDFAEKFVCTGRYLYQFLPAQKEIRAYELPKPKPGQVADDSFLGFLFGMKADEAKRRYSLNLAKEDKWYVYVDIIPRSAADKADFARARLVLNKGTFLPRQLWFEHTNKNEITWDIPRLQTGVTLDRRIFDTPRVPPDWKFQTVTRTTPPAEGTTRPRVIRSNPPER
jgi:TIGR03009 family protein